MPEGSEDPHAGRHSASSHIVNEIAEAGAFNQVTAGSAVGLGNVKNIGDMPALMANLAINQALHYQGMRFSADLDGQHGWRSMNQLLIGKMGEDLLTTKVTESLADQILLAAGIKSVQTLQPVTTPQPQPFAHPVAAPQPQPPSAPPAA